jgi:putative aminopeptidase FrvX
MQQLIALLKELTEIHAVSGYEDDMTRFMYDRMSELADETHVDKMGSVIAVRHGQSEGAPRVMLFAHMDEVGFMVRKRDLGYLRLIGLSGNFKALLGQEVQIRTFGRQLVRGLVGIKTAHLTSAAEWEKALDVDQLYVYPVDEGEEPAVEVGNTVSFRPDFRRLADDTVCAKALDNRVGCCVLLEVMRRLKDKELKATVAFVGTVQEEISCDGALAPSQAFGADMAITVDGTVCYDTPDTSPDGDVRCGSGPVITRLLRTPGLNGWTPNPKLALFIEQVARDIKVPTQRDAVHGLMSDAKPLRLGDVPSAVIGIPMRGKHSPAEIVSLNDVVGAVRLIVELAQRIDGSLDISRGH